MAPLLARFLQTPHDHVHSEEKDVGDVLRKVFAKAKVYMQLGSIGHAYLVDGHHLFSTPLELCFPSLIFTGCVPVTSHQLPQVAQVESGFVAMKAKESV